MFPRFNKDAEIVAIDGEMVQVAVGPMKMRVASDELVGVSIGGKSQSPAVGVSKSQSDYHLRMRKRSVGSIYAA